MNKAFDPKAIEEKWYAFWEKNNYFSPTLSSKKKAFSILLPPPNVTGVLHMGHALVNTLQDILIRYKRMDGFETLWLPGTDHAGIATQTVVERMLFEREGKKRSDYCREEFVQRIRNFVQENQSKILSQLKKMGCSCDWERLRFTLDPKSNRAVRIAFKKLFDDEYIYQGDYLVNWDPITQTAIADDEVEYEHLDSFLWHFKYPLQDKSGYVTIATTRPETILADTAVAVHPKDSRFSHLIGKEILLPLTERKIPIIADPYVDPMFGSGAVKITPAHDPNDYEIALRHNLPLINIMTPDGKINEQGKAFQGLSMQEARRAVVKKMSDIGLLDKTEPYQHRVGISYRSKAIIEPYLSKQWFIKMGPFKKKLLAAVKKGKVRMAPESFKETYYHWIENLKDWCISRQLWWGHQIPIWYEKENPKNILCYDGEGVPEEVEENPDKYRQDTDVLDTWFSSALWPCSSLGWPEKTEDLQKFYPTTTLITGHDILFFWVARMILMGEYLMKDIPFHETFIHGLIFGKSYFRQKGEGISYVSSEEKARFDRGESLPQGVTAKWEKMSKSKGNVIDPLQIIDTYGTDALRMALASSVTHARQIDLDLRRFEEFKNFSNKIFHGAKFILTNLQPEKGDPLTSTQLGQGLQPDLFSLEDRWILSLLAKTVKSVRHFLDTYAFDKAANLAYEFFRKDLCSCYLEIVKPSLFLKVGTIQERENKQKLLAILLCQICRLLHPMAPFITEEIFSQLKALFPNLKATGSDPYTKEMVNALKAPACILAPFPALLRKKDIRPIVEKHFALLEKVVYSVRNIRSELKIPLGEPTDLYILCECGDEERKIVEKNKHILTALLKIGNLSFATMGIPAHHTFGSTAVVGTLKLFVPLPAALRKQEKERLEKEKEKTEKIVEITRKKLDDPEFRMYAPKEVVRKMENTLQEAESSMEEITKKLKQF